MPDFGYAASDSGMFHYMVTTCVGIRVRVQARLHSIELGFSHDVPVGAAPVPLRRPLQRR